MRDIGSVHLYCNEAFRRCRQIWAEERDAAKALQVLKSNRKDRTVEGRLLFGLSKSHKNDVVSINLTNQSPV